MIDHFTGNVANQAADVTPLICIYVFGRVKQWCLRTAAQTLLFVLVISCHLRAAHPLFLHRWLRDAENARRLQFSFHYIKMIKCLENHSKNKKEVGIIFYPYIENAPVFEAYL